MTSEVVQPWGDASQADGNWSFTRAKLEKHVNELCMGDKAAVLPAELAKTAQGGASAVSGFTGKVSKDDVEFLTKELLLFKPQAEKALAENDGDLTKALTALVASGAKQA